MAVQDVAVDVRAMLADVAGLGPFFAVDTNPAESADPTWRPLRDLYTDPEPLRQRIAHVRRTLGSDERVAASIAFQGLAARLLSAPFAAVVLHGVLPGLTAAALHWRAAASGPWPLWCAEPAGRAIGGADDAVAQLAAGVLDEHMAPLIAAVRAQVSIAAGLLWGSVASSVASAKAQVAARYPASALGAARVAAGLLDTGALIGSAELRAAGTEGDWTFRRRSCCLYYRVQDGGLCGDCVLQARPPRR